MLEMEAFVIEFSSLSVEERRRSEGKKNLMDDFLRRKNYQCGKFEAVEPNKQIGKWKEKRKKYVEVYRAFEEKNSRNL